MLTIIESPLFSKLWPDYWTEEQRGEFATYLACNPELGSVIPNSGGCRKIRWSKSGTGKSGGVRIIYTTKLEYEVLVLLTIYSKSAQDNIPAHILRKISEELSHGS
jgi:mRNA-degrading endonuclease RelE of RelBE toxin-antitoxin system